MDETVCGMHYAIHSIDSEKQNTIVDELVFLSC